MAAKSTINYNDMKGQPQSVQSWKTGVVVKANQGELNSENARFDTETGPGLEGRKTIIIRKFTMNIFKDEDIRKDYVHEFGHFLGVDGHPTGFENTDEGVTSREPKNVILKGTDVLPMLQGAAKEGVMVKGTP
jgi:hypothetical protein